MRRFQKIDVNEPSVDDAIKIVIGLKPYYEDHHRVRYTNDAVRAAVTLSSKYINDRKLPDKAIDVIDEVGAARMLVPESQAPQDGHGQGYRRHHRQDRAHSAEDGLARRPDRAR